MTRYAKSRTPSEVATLGWIANHCIVASPYHLQVSRSQAKSMEAFEPTPPTGKPVRRKLQKLRVCLVPKSPILLEQAQLLGGSTVKVLAATSEFLTEQKKVERVLVDYQRM